MGRGDEASRAADRSEPPADRLRRGDVAAFHALVEEHGAYLYRVALALTGRVEDAEDVVQAALLAACRSIRSFRGAASLKTWLTRILLRQAGRHRKKLARRRSVPLDAARPVESNGEAEPASDVRMDVTAALHALPAAFREVVVLREFSGLRYEQIAELLGLPRGTVESRLFRARRRLRELLRGYIDHE